jgi:hypothetical protein
MLYPLNSLTQVCAYCHETNFYNLYKFLTDSEWFPEAVEESECQQKKNRRLERISSLTVHPVGH